MTCKIKLYDLCGSIQQGDPETGRAVGLGFCCGGTGFPKFGGLYGGLSGGLRLHSGKSTAEYR